MAAESKISFSFDEEPKWRKVERTTSNMLEDIAEWRKEYITKFKDNSQPFLQKFARIMAIDYIQNLNFEEMVGTQAHEDTEEILNKVFENRASDSDIQGEAKETVGTYKAMEKLFALHETMEKTGVLTVDQICDVHRILLKDLHPNGGEIRKSWTYTRWNKGPHVYPSPEIMEGLLYALVDHHNICIESCPSDETSEEYISYIFKCAARLLFEFVDIHPFGDGNGRMCRLLANHIVGLVTPFPVALYHKCEERNQRMDYINAIVSCREHPEDGPGELGAMLVEGAWHGWKKLLSQLKGLQSVPIVIRKSQYSQQDVAKRISLLWSYLVSQGVKETKEEVIKLALAKVEDTDVTTLSADEYLTEHVLLGERMQLLIEISK